MLGKNVCLADRQVRAMWHVNKIRIVTYAVSETGTSFHLLQLHLDFLFFLMQTLSYRLIFQCLTNASCYLPTDRCVNLTLWHVNALPID